MSSLIGALSASGAALDVFTQVLQTIQTNVANAQTPGYVTQTQTVEPLDQGGLVAGVKTGAVISSRDEYAEQQVRTQTAASGAASQAVTSLTSLQSQFDVSASAAIPNALGQLFQSFSAWGQTPGDPTAGQNVIQAAGGLASAFQQEASGLSQFTQDTNQQLQNNVSQINTLAQQLQTDNKEILQGDRQDPALDAQIHNTLDQLSNYAGVSASKQSDGSYTVLLGGQTPLVVGDKQYNLQFGLAQPANPPATNLNGPPLAQILDSNGTDVTSQVTTGQLGALLNVRNTVLPTYIGNSTQQGSLNTMAQQFADRVNQLLTSGNISDGPPPQTGVPLFTYDSANPTNVAASLAVNPGITSDQLAAIQPGPPEVANGIPLALSQLSNPQDAADQIAGGSYTQYYATMAAGVGTALNTATGQQQSSQSALTQAQNMVQQESGVDLNQQAASLVEFQRAYEANSKMISVLDQLTLDTINMMTPST
jgi:flagellar hook-associated protein 1 FlgK